MKLVVFRFGRAGRLRLKETEEDKLALTREMKELHQTKVKCSSDIEGKEETSRKLEAIGFSEEDLDLPPVISPPSKLVFST